MTSFHSLKMANLKCDELSFGKREVNTLLMTSKEAQNLVNMTRKLPFLGTDSKGLIPNARRAQVHITRGWKKMKTSLLSKNEDAVK